MSSKEIKGDKDGTSVRQLFLSIKNRAVIVASLGYFIDIYDLVLFSIVRIKSLTDLGYQGDELTSVGMMLLNYQMSGLLVGGIAWGTLGDRRGRLSVLFGSIALYSVANILNSFVYSVEQYALLRFFAGVGLAGELGAAVTLVVESLPVSVRGFATSFIAALGILGAIFAALTAEFLDWRFAYALGGSLGLLLLVARTKLHDSPIYTKARQSAVTRGNFLMLFTKLERFRRYLYTVAIGIPCWFVLGILLAFGPEITSQLGITGTLIVGTGIMFQYAGAALGDLLCGLISQKMRSRNKVVFACLLLTCLLVTVFLSVRGMSPSFYYALYFCLGLSTGYWAVFVTIAAEQFGTNIRATAATTAPNFVRGAVIPMSLVISAFKTNIGLVYSVALVASIVMLGAFYALGRLKDSYRQDLAFEEA